MRPFNYSVNFFKNLIRKSKSNLDLDPSEFNLSAMHGLTVPEWFDVISKAS